MARGRLVKPEFWSDDKVGACSIPARLLFIATWNFADDAGGLDRSAKQLKAQAFPYDDIDCEPLVQELLQQGLMVEYQAGGKNYLHVPNLVRHQPIQHRSQPRYPVYEPSLRAPIGVFPQSQGSNGGHTEDTHSPHSEENRSELKKRRPPTPKTGVAGGLASREPDPDRRKP